MSIDPTIQADVNNCMNSYSNLKYWCPQPGQEDIATITENCGNFCDQDLPNGCRDLSNPNAGDYAAACSTYCSQNNVKTKCPPAPSQSVIFRGSSSSRKINIKNKDILVLISIILVIYLITTSRFVYAITNKILPTLDNNQPSLLGYSLHTILFLLGVFLTLKYYKISCDL